MEYVLFGHALQLFCDAPPVPSLYVLDGHVEQSFREVAPVLLEYVPGGQGMHTLLSGAVDCVE